MELAAMKNVPPGIQTIRGVMGVCHLLLGPPGEAVLIDTGLIGEPAQIRWRLRQHGLGPQHVKAILLTHGHLDHAGNLAWAKAWTGAPIYAHPAERKSLFASALRVDPGVPHDRGTAGVSEADEPADNPEDVNQPNEAAGPELGASDVSAD
jgi:glyoxylase-like metal-dependent hydrolase (beta-lactamase superfamily II)